MYCRASGARSRESETRRTRQPHWNGIHRIVLPAIRHKYFETVSHTLPLRARRAAPRLRRRPPLQRRERLRPPAAARGADSGRDQRRRHRAPAPQVERRSASAVYAIGESFSALFANRVVADAEVIADYYREQLRHRAGHDPVRRGVPGRGRQRRPASGSASSRGNYILYVSRFEPENNPLEVVRGVREAATRRAAARHARRRAATHATSPPSCNATPVRSHPLSRRALRRRLPDAAAQCAHLHPGHGSRRDASGA